MTLLQTGAFAAGGSAEVFLLARLLFGGVLAFMGLNHFLSTEDMVGYAQFKGLPAPKFSVLASGGLLVLGGLGIVVGAFPALAGLALALFLVVSGVVFHDFWTVDDPEEQQTEMTNFLKNLFGAAGALTFVAVAGASWPYSVGIALL